MATGTQELNRYNMGEPQSEMNTVPPTIASAATIAPTHKFTKVTGTTQVGVITPPMPGFHIIWLMFTNASPGAFLTTGNIAIAYTPIVNRPIALLYDPMAGKYYPAAVV
jgi:hypothetical protein